MRTAAVYARVSTADQADNGTSLDTQAEACVRYAEGQGYVVIKTVREDVSGGTLARPGLDQLRDMAAQGAYDALVFYAPDRLSRDETGINALLLYREFGERGVQFVCPTVRIEDTPEGRFHFTVLAAVAGLERAQILERTRRGRHRKVLQGAILGGHFEPYGYSYTPGTHRYEVVEEEARWVRKMYEWLVEEGLSASSIVRRLNERGVPTKHRAGRGWHNSTVIKILHNRLYTGRWEYGRRTPTPTLTPEGSVPPLIDPSTYDAAQERLRLNKELSPRNAHRVYLLSGLLFCGLCGYRLTGATATTTYVSPLTGETTRYRRHYYRCPASYNADARSMRGRCPLPSLQAPAVEDRVWGEVARQLTDPERLSAAWPGARTEYMESRDRRLVSDAETRLARLKSDGERLLDLYLPGDITREEFTARLSQIRRQEQAAQRELDDARSRLRRMADDITRAARWELSAEKVRRDFPRLGVPERRALMVEWELRGLVRPAGEGECGKVAVEVMGLPEPATLLL